MAEHILTCGAEFFMDFAFMHSSTEDYKWSNKSTDRIVTLYNGYSAHLIIVDGASCQVWAFLTKSKEPPIDILQAFMKKFGIGTGIIRTNQGGKLACSNSFWEIMLKDFGYFVEPMAANSPSWNGGGEIYNNTLAVKVWTLLYGTCLSAKFWSAALLHAVYLHNCLVHSATNKTPYEGWYGRKPNVTHLKTFGSRACVKRMGSHQCKLDQHDFTDIFLGYTATDQNIIYLELNSMIVKTCHHAIFNEAWYLQPTRSLTAQLHYDLGLEAETDFMLVNGPLNPSPLGTITPVTIPWPPFLPRTPNHTKSWKAPLLSLFAPLPLQITDSPHTIGARAAQITTKDKQKSKKAIAADVISEYLIGATDMAMTQISPDPYWSTFDEEMDLSKFDIFNHRTAGPCFFEKAKRILLASMAPSTTGAKYPWWWTWLWGAWPLQIDGSPVTSMPKRKPFLCNCCPKGYQLALFYFHTQKSHPTFQPWPSYHVEIKLLPVYPWPTQQSTWSHQGRPLCPMCTKV
jgi:hypothetical protein